MDEPVEGVIKPSVVDMDVALDDPSERRRVPERVWESDGYPLLAMAAEFSRFEEKGKALQRGLRELITGRGPVVLKETKRGPPGLKAICSSICKQGGHVGYEASKMR